MSIYKWSIYIICMYSKEQKTLSFLNNISFLNNTNNNLSIIYFQIIIINKCTIYILLFNSHYYD